MTHDARFVAAMMALGEAFNEPVSEVKLEAYADVLSDLEPVALMASMRACLRDGRFFPRPAEIRERVIGKTEDRAEADWSAVQEAVRRVGYTGWPSALSEEAHAAIRATWGSWGRLCETLPAEGPELLGWRKAFLAAYGAQERTTERAALTTGRLERMDQLAPGIRALVRGAK